jgi:hypothetical protein
MRIIDLDRDQPLHQNTRITIAGVVRATYSKPFPYFVIEDDSGTLICRPHANPPLPGAHVEITGWFTLATPDNCTIQLAILNEHHRAYIAHQTYACDLTACEFGTLPDADKLNLMWT